MTEEHVREGTYGSQGDTYREGVTYPLHVLIHIFRRPLMLPLSDYNLYRPHYPGEGWLTRFVNGRGKVIISHTSPGVHRAWTDGP